MDIASEFPSLRNFCLWCAGPEGSAGAAPPARSAALLAGRYNPDKTRVWGTATLRKLQGGPTAASPNRFAATALPWAMDLLTRAAEDSRGARLFRMQARTRPHAHAWPPCMYNALLAQDLIASDACRPWSLAAC